MYIQYFFFFCKFLYQSMQVQMFHIFLLFSLILEICKHHKQARKEWTIHIYKASLHFTDFICLKTFSYLPLHFPANLLSLGKERVQGRAAALPFLRRRGDGGLQHQAQAHEARPEDSGECHIQVSPGKCAVVTPNRWTHWPCLLYCA